MSKPTKSDCVGCEQDFYNGKNPYGVEECWSLKTAEWSKKIRIHVDQAPPYRHMKPERMPSCYQVKRFVMVKPEAIGADGYWKR